VREKPKVLAAGKVQPIQEAPKEEKPEREEVSEDG